MAAGVNRGRVVGLVVVAVVGLAIGFGASQLFGGGGSDPAPATPEATTASSGDSDALAELPEPGPLLDPAEATTPELAVEGFLAAEARADFGASYEFLSSADREVAFPSAANWVQAHGGFVPVDAYEVGAVSEGDPTTVEALVGAEPRLDPVLGLIPYRSRTTYAVEEEDGVWRVVSNATTRQALFPSDEGAVAAAREWAERRAACEDTAEQEADLLGTPALAEELCTAGGEVELSGATTLGDTDAATSLLSAWGPEVFGWARVVRVQSPARMSVVLGPFADEWRVVGVLPATG